MFKHIQYLFWVNILLKFKRKPRICSTKVLVNISCGIWRIPVGNSRTPAGKNRPAPKVGDGVPDSWAFSMFNINPEAYLSFVIGISSNCPSPAISFSVSPAIYAVMVPASTHGIVLPSPGRERVMVRGHVPDICIRIHSWISPSGDISQKYLSVLEGS